MFSICAPVRPSMPSGFSRKSIVASETIWLSSVIAKRWKAVGARRARLAAMLLGAALGDRAW